MSASSSGIPNSSEVLLFFNVCASLILVLMLRHTFIKNITSHIFDYSCLFNSYIALHIDVIF